MHMLLLVVIGKMKDYTSITWGLCCHIGSSATNFIAGIWAVRVVVADFGLVHTGDSICTALLIVLALLVRHWEQNVLQ